MNPYLVIDSTASDHFNLSVIGPNGAKVASDLQCFTDYQTSTKPVDYVGNGIYTAVLATFNNSTCTGAPATQQSLPFTITGSVTLAPQTRPFLTRQPGKFATTTVPVGIDLNPGALSNDVFVGVNVAPNADGSLPGTPEQLFPDAATRTVGVPLDKGPGAYVVAARAKGYTGALNPQAFSPWAMPIAIRAYAPFDLKTLVWTDSRGPSYRLRATINEASATGRVSISIGRGTKGRLRPFGSAKIRRHVFSKRFRLTRTGMYRAKFTYKGNATVAGGYEIRRFRITRRIVFRSASAASAAVGRSSELR